MFEYNKDVKKRDEIIFGEYDEEQYMGGVRDFERMDVDTLKMMVEMKYADPKEQQNNSPTIAEFIEFMEENEGYTVGGYVVSIHRNDYRVSIESIDSDEPFGTFEQLEKFCKFARWADEFDTRGYAWWD